MTPIDWSKPIEAVHEDGRIRDARLDKAGDNLVYPTVKVHGLNFICPVREDGVIRSQCDWRIRNVVTKVSDTSGQPSPELVERMVALVRRMAAMPANTPAGPQGMAELAEVRSIVDALPAQVDVDLIEAREIAVELYGKTSDMVRYYRGGRCDTSPEVLNIKAGIKSGRQLEREGR